MSVIGHVVANDPETAKTNQDGVELAHFTPIVAPIGNYFQPRLLAIIGTFLLSYIFDRVRQIRAPLHDHVKEREAERGCCVLKIVSKVGTPSNISTTRKFKRMKPSLSQAPRASETDPKRTASHHLGDAWQSKTEYEIKKEGKRALFPKCLIYYFVVDVGLPV